MERKFCKIALFCLHVGKIYDIITKQYRFALMVKRFKTSPSHGGN